MTADEYAISIGFYGAENKFEWNGLECWDIVMTKSPLEPCPRIGPPVFIIRTTDGWRESTPEEAFEYIRS